jgi:hypothetical protein
MLTWPACRGTPDAGPGGWTAWLGVQMVERALPGLFVTSRMIAWQRGISTRPAPDLRLRDAARCGVMTLMALTLQTRATRTRHLQAGRCRCSGR